MLERAGHAESTVDLAQLAGKRPGGAISEIMNDGGNMARILDKVPVARCRGLSLISMEDLIAYRRRAQDRENDDGDSLSYCSKPGVRSHVC
ncbi:3,4-dihydroxy-2-butanone-4-phosphate synthase [Streptomyces sp. NPDC096153]|uniref:3,4-dihydroxy-2-butanone-4-phosphate synthase n=1 Tax=Streptomyces sp. NPDC096153 TaxID=3155548 RepID=UPI00331BAC4F